MSDIKTENIRPEVIKFLESAEEFEKWVFDAKPSEEELDEIYRAVSSLLLMIRNRNLSEMVSYVRFLERTVAKKVWKEKE